MGAGEDAATGTFYPPTTYGRDLLYNADTPESAKVADVNLMFFRMNKLWGYIPYDKASKGTSATNAAQPVNDIGVKCYFTPSSQCEEGDTGFDYNGNVIACDNTDYQSGADADKDHGTLSKGGAVKIDMLNSVMSTQSGFPWQGGVSDLTFGALLVTWDKSKTLANTINARTPKDALEVRCEWGVELETGVDATGTEKSTRSVENRIKPGYAGVANTKPPAAVFFITQTNGPDQQEDEFTGDCLDPNCSECSAPWVCTACVTDYLLDEHTYVTLCAYNGPPVGP
jgi:hypothetical protein